MNGNSHRLKLLEQAIVPKKIIIFNYHGYHRIAEPHHYGILNQELQLHAYQISGGSETGGIPEWRNFKIAEIKNLHIEQKSFQPRHDHLPPANYSQIDAIVTR